MKNKKSFVENRKLKFSRGLFSRDIHRFIFGSFGWAAQKGIWNGIETLPELGGPVRRAPSFAPLGRQQVRPGAGPLVGPGPRRHPKED